MGQFLGKNPQILKSNLLILATSFRKNSVNRSLAIPKNLTGQLFSITTQKILKSNLLILTT